MASDKVFSVFSVKVERVNKRYMMTYDMNTIALSMSRIHQNGKVFLLKYQFAILCKMVIFLVFLGCKGTKNNVNA